MFREHEPAHIMCPKLPPDSSDRTLKCFSLAVPFPAWSLVISQPEKSLDDVTHPGTHAEYLYTYSNGQLGHLLLLGQHHTLLSICTIENSHSLLVRIQNGTGMLEDSLAVSYKTKHALTVWSSNHMGLYPKDLRTHVHTKTYTWMLLVTLLIIVKT